MRPFEVGDLVSFRNIYASDEKCLCLLLSHNGHGYWAITSGESQMTYKNWKVGDIISFRYNGGEDDAEICLILKMYSSDWAKCLLLSSLTRNTPCVCDWHFVNEGTGTFTLVVGSQQQQ